MPTTNVRLNELFNRWCNSEASETEANELMDLLSKADDEHVLEGIMKESYDSLQGSSFFTASQKNQIINTILLKKQRKIFPCGNFP